MKAIVPVWRANSLSKNWFNEFDHLFDNFFDERLPAQTGLVGDIEESEKNYLFSIDLPGLEEKEISVEVKEGVLTISGERKSETNEGSTRTFQGRKYGAFKHSFSLPKSVDQDGIEAEYTNGVLKVLLPKQEVAQPKKILLNTKKGGLF